MDQGNIFVILTLKVPEARCTVGYGLVKKVRWAATGDWNSIDRI